MALIAIPVAIGTAAGVAQSGDAAGLRTQLERAFASLPPAELLVDVQLTGSGAGAVWQCLLVTTSDPIQATPIAPVASCLVRVVIATDSQSLNAQINIAGASLFAAGAVWLAKLIVAGGGSGVAWMAVLIASTSPRPTGPSGPPVPDAFPYRIDHSVNAGRVENPYSTRPILRCQSGGNAPGGFNGGGTGNKAILGFPVGAFSLAGLNSLEWTWFDRTSGNEPGLPVYANLMLDLLGTGSDWRIGVIDPLAGPGGINNGSTVTNGDGSKTTTWTAAANWLLIVNGLTVGLPPALPPFVPPDFSVVPLAPYGLPSAWQSCSWSVGSILAAWPNCRVAFGATGDFGLPKTPNVTLGFCLITGDSTNNDERAWELRDVKVNGVPL